MAVDPSQIPVQAAPFEFELPNFTDCLFGLGPVTIVAIGSSTTAGEGGIVAYPYRLEALFRKNHARPMIDVINRGVGGEEAPAEFARFDQDVLPENPSLVIWQVGTNSVWQSPDQKPPSRADTIQAIRDGVNKLRGVGGIDVILMDPQYTPAMLTPAKEKAAREMIAEIAGLAADMKVNLFRRFELMEGWHTVERIPLDRMVDPGDPDRLHDSDWATQKVTETLYGLITASVARTRAAHVTTLVRP
ncbi:MAG: GDSL-type esterase/lipase family protein [Xanthobacteraceae bacterium]|nr:GDSL-type esterase/lipase family protein [Xanthobacteraceae bacterium]